MSTDTDAEAEAAIIAAQNDAFRTSLGANAEIPGRVVVTRGVANKGAAFQIGAAEAVRTFSRFTEDNDPWNQHDLGAFDIDGSKLFWKIDLFDVDYRYGSEHPTDTSKTRRVLTIMLADEY